MDQIKPEKAIEPEIVENDLKTRKIVPGLRELAVVGGPGRPPGKLNKFSEQKNEFFRACKDGRLFKWVQEVLDGKSDERKMEILRVWASLQPREVRSEFDRMPVVINVIRADGSVHMVGGEQNQPPLS